MPEERLHREPGQEYVEELHSELRSRYGLDSTVIVSGVWPRLQFRIPYAAAGFADTFEDNVLVVEGPGGRWSYWWPWVTKSARPATQRRPLKSSQRRSVSTIAYAMKSKQRSGTRFIPDWKGRYPMGRAVWCDVPEAGHAFNEHDAIMVADRQITLFFCLAHQTSALATAFQTARKEGKCGVAVPSLGDFQLISEAVPDDSDRQQAASKAR